MSGRPLLETYPGLQPVLPYVPLANLPTDVEKLEGVLPNLWIKRDDRSANLYGGNKVRKLEFIFGHMNGLGKKRLVTFGATGTNHGVATALYCRELGIDCTVLLFDQPDSPTVRSNYEMMRAAGAKLIPCGSLFKTVARFYTLQRLLEPDSYFLFAGGSTVQGASSFVNAAYELRQQLDEQQLPHPDFIVCAVGSAGTMAGLNLGCAMAGLNSRVIGIRVAPSHLGPIPVCTVNTVSKLRQGTWDFLAGNEKSIPDTPITEIELMDDYYGDGYGVATVEGRAATESFANAGVVLEQTYTAKAAAAALSIAQRHPKRQVLFWHTFNSMPNSMTSSLPATG